MKKNLRTYITFLLILSVFSIQAQEINQPNKLASDSIQITPPGIVKKDSIKETQMEFSVSPGSESDTVKKPNSPVSENLEKLLNDMEEEKTEYISAAFKGSRVINLHSLEKVTPGALEFRISHRFGSINGGSYTFFGLDQSTIRFGLEYGINGWLMVGLGRSSYQKTYDFFLKGNILRQSTGKKNMPFSLLIMSSMTVNGLRWDNPSRTNYQSSRLAFVHQLIIGRKFNERLSLEIVPTIVHKNLVETEMDINTQYAVGIGGRYKITKRVSINGEYIWRVPPSTSVPNYDSYYNSFSLGFDIETGGHVFQLHVTNSLPMIEKGFITETTDKWDKIGVHLGFNISREFNLNKKKNKKW